MAAAQPVPETAARIEAQRAARNSYGRLLSSLAYRWRDIAAAEDALAEAFARALETWPGDGVPRAPDAWLTAVAKNQLLRQARHRRVALDPAITILLEQDEAAPENDAVIADERLRLLFVCAHPSIDADIRTPLMLQVVLGLEAKHIAAAMLLKPSALAQRLVRAKLKIRDAGVRFELPETHDMAQRSHAVLEAVYAAHSLGWHHARGLHDALQGQSDLAAEAIFLGELCAAYLPNNAEALGLLSLLQYCEARRDASATEQGGFVPLHQQDPARWNRPLLEHAQTNLWQASAMKQPGPFQLEAAIQSAHCQRAVTGSVPWQAIAQLYSALQTWGPSIGATVGQAVALAESSDMSAGLELLQSLDAKRVDQYQPYWVALAHIQGLLGRQVDAGHAYRMAIGLTEHAAIRAYLQGQLEKLG